MYATAYAIAGKPLTQPIMPEAVIALGYVPLAKYGRPSTDEIPDAVEEYLPYFDAVLLENHGALTYSDSLLAAYHKMEAVEFYAKLLYLSTQIGGPQEFSPKQVEDLYDIRRKFGMTGKHPADGCTADLVSPTPAASTPPVDEALVSEITRRVLAALGK